MLVFGQTIEDENKYIVVGGWPTVEVSVWAKFRWIARIRVTSSNVGPLGDCRESSLPRITSTTRSWRIIGCEVFRRQE
jgi:hypothetical protein